MFALCGDWEEERKMAQRKHSLATIAGGQALKPRAKAALQPKPVPVQATEDADHFITRDGVTFAGHHLIIDLWEAEGLDDHARIEKAMRDAVDAAGATLLHIHLHTFEPNGGISGVAVLAESHISVHTWPEKGYAAFERSLARMRERRSRAERCHASRLSLGFRDHAQ